MTTEEVVRIYSEEDYRGEHSAPDSTPGTSMDNMVDIYPEDIYGPNAVRYYGDYSGHDSGSISIIQSARNRPNYPVKIYRAVPKVITNEDKINKYVKEQAYIMRHGKLPPKADRTDLNRSDY